MSEETYVISVSVLMFGALWTGIGALAWHIWKQHKEGNMKHEEYVKQRNAERQRKEQLYSEFGA